MARNVFVSYASRDRDSVQKMLEQLRRRRVLDADDNVFVDQESFAVGDSFRDATRAAIGASDTVLVLWSHAAADSKWVNYELAMADALGKQVLVAVPRGMRAQLPLELSATQVVELSGG